MDDLRDRPDLADLVQRDAALVDHRDVDGVVALFTTDAVLVSPEPPRSLLPVREGVGETGISEALAALDGLVRTVHEVHGHVLESLGPDEATGRTTGAAHHLMETAEGLRDVVWHVVYRDKFQRTESGWRFARREITINALDSRPVARARGEEH